MKQFDNHQPLLVCYFNTFGKTIIAKGNIYGNISTQSELQNWLQDAGIFVKLEIEPPAEEEMGGKVTALILAFSLVSEFGHLPPSVEEAFRQIEEWQQQQQQVIRPVIHLSGKKKLDEEIQEVLRREQWHISEQS